MPDPVVHFEIIGADPARLREYYARLFGWRFETESPVAAEISEQTSYSFLPKIATPDGGGIPGGVGGGPGFESHAVFYVGVPDVEAALREAERLGGTRVLGPVVNHGGGIAVGHFRDPEGTLVGVAGPAA